jgi:multidrug resistance efflux pump
MHVRHERPNPDLSFRVAAPLLVGLGDGTVVRVREWSLRALYSPDFVGRDLDGASLSIPFQGVQVYFPVTLCPGEAPGEVLLQNLSGRQRETLALFYRNLLSGRMAATADIITALDTPVDLVPMGETEGERAAAAAATPPRAPRVVINVLAYVLLAATVFGWLGTLAYERFNGLPLSNARVAAQAALLVAPFPASVGELAVPEGVEVPAGTVLLRLRAPELQRMLDDLAGPIVRAEAALAAVDRRIAEHADRRDAARAAAPQGPEVFDTGVSAAPGDYHDIRLRLEAELREREQDLRLLEAEAGRLRDALAALEVRAPEAGRVLAHRVVPGQAVGTGAPLVLFEGERRRTVEGWLSDSYADAVWPGMRATVRLRRDGEVEEFPGIVARAEGEGPQAAGRAGAIRVEVALDGLTAEEARDLLTIGAPVRVTLSRDLWRSWLGLRPAASGG